MQWLLTNEQLDLELPQEVQWAFDPIARQETFTGENFEVLWLFAKFSPWNLRVWHLFVAQASNLEKFSL